MRILPAPVGRTVGCVVLSAGGIFARNISTMSSATIDDCWPNVMYKDLARLTAHGGSAQCILGRCECWSRGSRQTSAAVAKTFVGAKWMPNALSERGCSHLAFGCKH